MRNWVLVADGGRARFFKIDRKAKRLREGKNVVNPEVRFSEREFSRDTPGRSYDSMGKGRHSMESSAVSKEKSKEEFARTLVEHLNEQFGVEKIDRIIVVAPAKMLGYLNKYFQKVECGKLVTQIAKDVTTLEPEAIYSILEKEVSQI